MTQMIDVVQPVVFVSRLHAFLNVTFRYVIIYGNFII